MNHIAVTVLSDLSNVSFQPLIVSDGTLVHTKKAQSM